MKRPTIELVELMLRDALACDHEHEVARWAHQLDELDAELKRSKSVALISAALWYAEQGLHVFPIVPGQKTPYPGTRGLHDATSDVEQVRRWWSARPDSNIGIATGHIVNVIDIDGYRGNVSLLRVLRGPHETDTTSCDCDECDERHRRFDSCVGKVSTPRAGGRHLYMPAKSYGNRAGMFEGVDYRGRGGYVLAPPSRTELGLYTWTAALDVDAAKVRSVA